MSNKQLRITYFDVARFFAIFGVLAVHVGQNSLPSVIFGNYMSFGRFGVQLFFVISGATVYLTYAKAHATSENPVSVFYIKRFFRIIPLFILMAGIYWFFDDIPFFKTIIPWNGINPDVYNNIEGGWSIWNEMYFYLFFPLYFKFRKSKSLNTIFPIMFVFISVLINFRYFGLNDSELLKDFDYLNFFTQFVCFVIGVEYLGKNYFNLLVYVFSYLTIGFLAKYLFFRDMLLVANYGASYWTPLIGLVCLGFIVCVKYIMKWPVSQRLRAVKMLSYLGTKTYTTYMVHFLIIRLLVHLNWVFVFEFQLLLVATSSFMVTILIEKYTEGYWVGLGQKIIHKYL
tara:strand:- start:615 stop:1640 length:1026 start_codon:yes stop_codon:yes gene_type:complete